jgi:hypothetical protein
MATSEGYGQRLAERLRAEQAHAIVTRVLRTADMAVTETRCDDPMLGLSYSIQQEDEPSRTAWRKPAIGSSPSPSAAKPMAQRSYDECNRTATRGVQAQDQDADRAAVGRYSGHVVLGAACFRPDQHAQGRRSAKSGHKAHRSAN